MKKKYNVAGVTHMSPAPVRFGASVDRLTGPVHPRLGRCWVWTGPKTPKGYGQFGVNRLNVRAHRYAWESVHGLIPNGLCVLHKCDNPGCVRLTHLFIGTSAENQNDKRKKGRSAKGEGNAAHILTANDVREIRRRYKLKRGYHDPINGQNALARNYGVSQAAIFMAINRQTWKHVK